MTLARHIWSVAKKLRAVLEEAQLQGCAEVARHAQVGNAKGHISTLGHQGLGQVDSTEAIPVGIASEQLSVLGSTETSIRRNSTTNSANHYRAFVS